MRTKAMRALVGVAALALAASAVGAAPPAPHLVSQPGRVEAAEEARLHAAISGYVESVAVDIGDRVKKGDVLVVLAAPERQAELHQKEALTALAKAQVVQSQRAGEAAQAALDALKARLEQAEASAKRAQAQRDYRKAEYARFKELEQSKAIDSRLLDEKQDQVDAAEAAAREMEAALKGARADQAKGAAEVEAAQADVKVAEARVQAAEADVQRAQVVLEFARLRAPFDGVVTRRTVHPGDFVQPPTGDRDQPLLVVTRVDPVRVVVDVPDADAVRVKPGAPAVIRLDALPKQEFQGKVSRVAGVLDPKTRTLRVEIDLPNPDGKLMPGMYGTVVVTPDEGAPGGADKPKGQSGLVPVLPPGTSAPIVLPFDPTAKVSVQYPKGR